jgi:tryptophan 2,3-dioxygenase
VPPPFQHPPRPLRRPEHIVHDEKAQLDFSRDMSYGDYLQLDAILSAQHPLSPDHNEMLFIVQHQTSELWMKLMLHELRAAVAHVAPTSWARLQDAGAGQQDHGAAGARLGRAGHHDAARVQRHPPLPGHSSGFQSWQYRCIEFALGNKNAAMLKPHAHRPDLLAQVQAAYDAPVAVRRGAAPAGAPRPGGAASHTQRDWTQPYAASPGSKQAWLHRLPQPRSSTGTCTSWARS